MPLTRAQLREASRARLRDVEVLFNNQRYDAAVYFSGYVLELALKAKVMRHLRLAEYPERDNYFKTHDLPRLRRLAGVEAEIDADSVLAANWSTVSDWDPSIRYEEPGKYTSIDARRRLDALKDQPKGLLTWLKARW